MCKHVNIAINASIFSHMCMETRCWSKIDIISFCILCPHEPVHLTLFFIDLGPVTCRAIAEPNIIDTLIIPKTSEVHLQIV